MSLSTVLVSLAVAVISCGLSNLASFKIHLEVRGALPNCWILPVRLFPCSPRLRFFSQNFFGSPSVGTS